MEYLATGEPGLGDLWDLSERAEALVAGYQGLLDDGDVPGARVALESFVNLVDRGIATGRSAHPAWPALITMAIEGHGEFSMLLVGLYSDPQLPEGDPADLEAAVAHAREALRLAPGPETPAQEQADVVASQRAILGMSLAMRYGGSFAEGSEPRWHDGQEAITQFKLARTELAEPDDPAICWYLGKLLADRYLDPWPAETPAAADRDEALSLLTLANRADPDSELPTTQLELAEDRLGETDDPTDRQTLIDCCESLLRCASELDDKLIAAAHDCLGRALLDRASYATDRQADRSAAIAHLEAELALTPADDGDRWSLFALLACAYWDYLDTDFSQHAVIDRMIDHAVAAWPLMPGGEERVQIGLYLGIGLYERFRRADQATGLDLLGLATDVLTEIEPQVVDPDVSCTILVMLMTCMAAYAQLTGSQDAMAAAEIWIVRAIEEVPAEDPQWAFAASNLSMGMVLLAFSDFSAQTTQKAIAVLTSVLQRPGIDPADAARIRGMLGMLLLAQVGGHRGTGDDLDRSIAYLREFWEVTEHDATERVMVATNLSTALVTRYTQRGDRQDLDAAIWYAAEVRQLAETQPTVKYGLVEFDATVAGLTGGLYALAGHADGDLRLVDAGVAELRSAVARVRPDSELGIKLRNDLGLALTIRSIFVSTGSGAYDEIIDLLRGGGMLPQGSDLRPVAIHRLVGVLTAKGAGASDPQPISTAIELMTDLLAELSPASPYRVRFSASLATSYRSRYRLTGDAADLRAAIDWLERSRDQLRLAPGHPNRCEILIGLARCYRLSNDLVQARETALTALRERGQDVLLQTGTARGLRLARQAASESAEVADWCLIDGDPDAAVTALELGRSLVLHAATVATGVAELLDDSGEAELASRWRAAASAQAQAGDDRPWDATSAAATPFSLVDSDMPMPDDVRARVLSTLSRAGTNRLTDSPPCSGIAEAVAQTGADALVYLLEPTGEGPGNAIILPAAATRRGQANVVELPLLARSMSGSLDGYIAAYRDWTSQVGEPSRRRRWQQALEQLCDWAWLTVMAPLLGHVSAWTPGRIPRVVLVPVGRLSIVPWHAARSTATPVPGRYACMDAVISYAASGRVLIDVSRRPARDLQAAPVIVADPAQRLPFAAIEAEAIASTCYPQTRYLGQVPFDRPRQGDGPGTPAELLAELPGAARPGASVLHLCCHVILDESAPTRSYLQLADGAQLTIETILRQAAGRPPQAAGGLVTLAACVSDYGVATYDEALSLASAFLACGAVTVASARWFIDDNVTMLLMFMFHYFMAHQGQSPRDALRLAQLWLLDPGRTAPPQMPRDLARDVTDLGSVEIAEWAAFTHQGR